MGAAVSSAPSATHPLGAKKTMVVKPKLSPQQAFVKRIPIVQPGQFGNGWQLLGEGAMGKVYKTEWNNVPSPSSLSSGESKSKTNTKTNNNNNTTLSSKNLSSLLATATAPTPPSLPASQVIVKKIHKIRTDDKGKPQPTPFEIVYREITVLQRIRQKCAPYLLCLKAVYQDATDYWLVFPVHEGYVDGATWIHSVHEQEQPLTIARTGRVPNYNWITHNIFVNAMLGIRHLHSLDMVHRDIKPANMLIGRKGEVVFIDFGLACSSADGGSTVNFGSDSKGGEASASIDCTQMQISGTPLYLAPELIQASRENKTLSYDSYVLSDAWALGMTFCAFLLRADPLDWWSHETITDDNFISRLMQFQTSWLASTIDPTQGTRDEKMISLDDSRTKTLKAELVMRMRHMKMENKIPTYNFLCMLQKVQSRCTVEGLLRAVPAVLMQGPGAI